MNGFGAGEGEEANPIEKIEKYGCKVITAKTLEEADEILDKT